MDGEEPFFGEEAWLPRLGGPLIKAPSILKALIGVGTRGLLLSVNLEGLATARRL